ncbi:hypothetical protein JB92DRAFT_2950298 [Gautieria morchelliformis]|nr:hypothetical protein JB92DRAFT_2950298 [Gautieria morchelliformis]
MGRPLYTSILLARHATEAAAQPAPPKPTYPVVEKWSRWNAFDPDSDEFFEADNAVYEAFLSDVEIAERTVQHHETARLLEESLLREADSITSGSPMSEDSDRSILVNEMDAAISLATQIEAGGVVVDEDAPEEVREAREGAPADGLPPRRQPHRAPAINEWRLSSAGELSPSVPHVSVVPAGSREIERASSPDPSNLVSGLQHLSESPRPLIPVDSPPRPVSPIPNTPARVSGVFGTPPSSGQTVTTPSTAPIVTPRVLAWAPQSIQFTTQWAPESPTPQDTSHLMGSFISSTPAPLTY